MAPLASPWLRLWTGKGKDYWNIKFNICRLSKERFQVVVLQLKKFGQFLVVAHVFPTRGKAIWISAKTAWPLILTRGRNVEIFVKCFVGLGLVLFSPPLDSYPLTDEDDGISKLMLFLNRRNPFDTFNPNNPELSAGGRGMAEDFSFRIHLSRFASSRTWAKHDECDRFRFYPTPNVRLREELFFFSNTITSINGWNLTLTFVHYDNK